MEKKEVEPFKDSSLIDSPASRESVRVCVCVPLCECVCQSGNKDTDFSSAPVLHLPSETDIVENVAFGGGRGLSKRAAAPSSQAAAAALCGAGDANAKVKGDCHNIAKAKVGVGRKCREGGGEGKSNETLVFFFFSLSCVWRMND